ncbi:bifunctional diguanylate cyclase/phosphodiesterase [Pseudidiomarina tainanensis]|jgi:diguanylate cyclase (GGDEF)-like protein|uniref:Diguanylate cyclase (GGDEF) domain-containing protein n=2 Tax=Pseudidiomarina TaxID=2800384 RepID=A0A1I6G5Z5_9GAMM|nr:MULTISPECIES: bifunctional diguanylate cyclase/phosphodiesterase [Pseudidiomarina]RZQ57110.1 bifunctional diguanylate cyclase/phosphodiesterase [Pseudidiomarina tainanensis]SFR37604.1 diguanylate cyclase (GGDEF) domain-containing protein [Pseudidiomarina maritima]
MSPRRAAAAIAFLYLFLGYIWISFSDRFLLTIAAESTYLTELQTYKGWAYVTITAALLYVLAFRALQRERNLSERDGLTLLLNRHMFERELASEIQYAYDNQQNLSVIMLNIDGFKQINSHVSLEAGDKFLVAVAGVLRESCHQQALIARFGNDEFAVALPDSTWPDAVLPVLQKIQRRIEHIRIPEAPQLSFTASAGLALYPRDGSDASQLIDAGNLALDQAQQTSRGSYKLYNAELSAIMSNKARLLFDLKAAIEKRQLSVVYQPQFCVQENRMTGLEVLVRWNHPERGVISPAEFIPLAEQNSLICGITDFVMRQAIDELTEHGLLYRDVQRVSFNVSAADFNGNESCDRFLANLSQLPGDWSVIELELTESAALLNLEGVRQVLEKLTAKGVQVSLDDFGTGYSSLNTLRLLPIQEVKIDQSFVKDIVQNKQDAKLVKTILAMAQALHLRVVAEGVETHAQANYLMTAGCQEFQGFLYARPMSINHLITFIKNLKQRQRAQS